MTIAGRDGVSDEPDVVAVVGGYVVPVTSRDLEGATVLIRGGVIEQVGMDVPIPGGATVVDATGMWVLPGFVEPHAHVGLHEENAGNPGADTNESSAPNTAGVRALDGINVEDPGFDDAREGGITTVIVKPGSANPFGGQCVALKTGGGPRIDDRVVDPAVSVKSAFGENPKELQGGAPGSPMTRMGIAHFMRQALTDVQQTASRDQAQPDLHSEALARLLSGEALWDVHVHRHDDIATAMRIADEFGLRLVINHGTDAYKLVDEVAKSGYPVVVGPLFSAATKVELAGHRMTTAAELAAGGVMVALTTDHPEVPIYLLATQAAVAMREGLPRDVALRSISHNPAAIYGLDDRIGSLTPGRDADIVLWSGDPLKVQSRVERVFIDGREA
jgi:imidazolonepropionase-like amidohydrolase